MLALTPPSCHITEPQPMTASHHDRPQVPQHTTHNTPYHDSLHCWSRDTAHGPGHNTRPIHPNHPRHAASPDVAQPTTTTATPTHNPMARTPQPAPPRTTTHDSRRCLSPDTAHGPATPTASSHGKLTPAPTTSNGHNASKAHAGQVLMNVLTPLTPHIATSHKYRYKTHSLARESSEYSLWIPSPR
jgi:hypothetical protein